MERFASLLPAIRVVIGLAVGLSVVAQSTLTITTSSLPYGTIGSSYTARLTSNGSRASTWFVRGNLPPGLALTTDSETGAGIISGTPNAGGTYIFMVGVSDSGSVTKRMSIEVAQISTPSPLPIAPPGTVYSVTFPVSDAPGGSYVWSGKGLPPGLTLNASSGVLSGVPATAGVFHFTITAVSDSTRTGASKTFTLTVAPTLVITTSTPLPSGTPAAGYSQTLQASGGIEPYKFSAAAATPFGGNALPPGLSLNPNGMLAGKPTTEGTFRFVAVVLDAQQNQAIAPFTITIGPPSPFAITTPSPLPGGTVGVSYSQLFHVEGGFAPYAFSAVQSAPISADRLPPGLSLNPNGTLAGIPGTVGMFSFTIVVVDARQNRTSSYFTLTIASPPINTPPTTPREEHHDIAL